MNFDPEQFLHATFTEANATQFEAIPVGEYTATIAKVEVKSGQTAETGNTWTRLDVTWDIDNDALKETLGRNRLSCRQGILLDITDSGGMAAGKGKNVNFGQLREAVDLNRPGEPFSLQMLTGRVAKIKINHRMYAGKLLEDVKGVARLA